jgi:two-component system chemotaxis response regulator CheB
MDDSSSGVSAGLGVVAVGGSAGGVEALIRFAEGLPVDLPYPVMVTLHMPVSGPSVLAGILDRHGALPAVAASDGEVVRPGHIYVSVPNRHLLLDHDRVALSDGPTENGNRPAINALFRSVALGCGSRAVGILLSGVLDDGVLGLAAIRSCGGTTIVQEPSDALFPSMPLKAIEAHVVDRQAPAKELGTILAELAKRDVVEGAGRDSYPNLELEHRIAMGGPFSTSFEAELLGPPSGYTCPDCNGSLMESAGHNFRCRIGHAWSGDSLLRARDEEVQSAMWIAVRSLQEKAKLSRKLADTVGPGRLHQRYCGLADEAENAMNVLSRRLSEGYAPRVVVDHDQ